MIIYFVMLTLGIALGSFTNALVWRVYEQSKKKNKERADLSILHGRSMCTSCEHRLAPKDLVPILSWLSLKGRCRYCSKSISWHYPLVELIGGLLVVGSFAFWPYEFTGIVSYILFALWVIIVINSLALTSYDLKWMLLPNKLVFSLLGVVAMYVLVLSVFAQNFSALISGIIGGATYGGFFYILYQISNGKWIGGGDVRLGFVLGLLLGWQKSILGLMLAAYMGTFVILILFLAGKYHKKMKLPFGPFLLLGAYIAFLWGQHVIDWYMKISGL